MERIEPEWVRGAQGTDGVVLRVFTGRPFFEVRVAADPKLFLEQNESARSERVNYWVSSPSGRPVPAAPEQDVRVPDDVVANTLGRGNPLYYLLVSYADESRARPLFSADPGDAARGELPHVRPRATQPPAGMSVAHSLLFDPSLMPPSHRAPAMSASLENGWSDAAPGHASAYDTPSRSSSAAFEWLDLVRITGGNKKKNVYFVTTGGTKDGALQFRVKVSNRNDHDNFWNCKFKLVLNRVSDSNPPRDTPIHIGIDEPKGAKVVPYVARWKEIEDESSSIVPFELSKQTIARLYDADNPKARIDFEFHWHEGVFNKTADAYYARTSLAFYLVKPANFLWQKAKVLRDELRFNNYKKHRSYWTALAEHTFGKSDKLPVVVKSAVTYALNRSGSVTMSSSSTTSATQTTADRKVTEVDVRVSAERSSGAKAGMKLEGLVDLGLETGQKLGVSAGIKKIRDVTKTKSETQTFMQSLAETSGFSENFGTSLDVTHSIEAKSPGNIRVLYAYPKFQVISVPAVLYLDVNAAGMAGKRELIEDFTLLKFIGIGTCIVELDPKTGEVVGGDCLLGDEELKKEPK